MQENQILYHAIYTLAPKCVSEVSLFMGMQNGKLENRSTKIRNFLLPQVNTSVESFSKGRLAEVIIRGSFACEGRYLMQSLHD